MVDQTLQEIAEVQSRNKGKRRLRRNIATGMDGFFHTQERAYVWRSHRSRGSNA